MLFDHYKYASYTERRNVRFKILHIFLGILLVFIIRQLIGSYIVTTYRIQAETMQPTLTAGDMIITNPLYSKQQHLERGTLVVVEPLKKEKLGLLKQSIQHAVSFLTFQLIVPFKNDSPSYAKPFVRRIVGVPGDTIYMDAFVLHIKNSGNNHFLTEFEVSNIDYNVRIEDLPENWDTALPFSGTYPQITLKDNEYFVLCDNRIASGDSRLWGPVQADTHIKARIVLRYWPFSRISFL